MLKLLGSVFVLCGGVMAVLQRMREERRRSNTLADITDALRRIAEEIRLLRTPLPRLLERAANGCGTETAAFFRWVSVALQNGETAEESWRQAAVRLPLPQRERSAVSKIGNCLKGDENSICNGILLAIYELKKSAEEWDRRRSEETKRTTALYLSGAAMLVILLL